MSGELYLVATPIGNLRDLSPRARECLSSCDILACEDTRTTRKLLPAGSGPRMLPHHEHNERASAEGLLKLLLSGKKVALVTEAGTPLVSDPGYRLVTGAVEAGVKVVPVPGACAAVSALAASGLPTDRFTFLGYPPRKAGKLRRFLEDVSDRRETLVFFESPRRVWKLLRAALEVLGDRPACVAREMTKVHEEFIRGKLSGLCERIAGELKGECTVVTGGRR